MTVLITLPGFLGADTGPTFNLYSSPDGITFTTIELGVDKTELLEGYQMPGYYATVPNNTTKIKVTSVGSCTNFEVATIGAIPALYYEHNLSAGYATSSAACSDTTLLWTVYTQNQVISAEDILYTDNGFTDGLLGGLLYYKDINGSNYFKVRDNGSVELIGTCT